MLGAPVSFKVLGTFIGLILVYYFFFFSSTTSTRSSQASISVYDENGVVQKQENGDIKKQKATTRPSFNDITDLEAFESNLQKIIVETFSRDAIKLEKSMDDGLKYLATRKREWVGSYGLKSSDFEEIDNVMMIYFQNRVIGSGKSSTTIMPCLLALYGMPNDGRHTIAALIR